MSLIKEDFVVIKNTIFLNVSTLATNVVVFFSTVLIGRYLDKTEFGIYVFVLGLVGLFDVFIDLGAGYLVVRELARDKEEAGKYLSAIVLFKTLVSFVIFAIIYILTERSVSNTYQMALRIATLAIILESFGNFFGYMFNAFERMKYTATLSFLLKMLLLLGALLVFKLKGSLLGILWIKVLAAAIYALLSYFILVGILKITNFKFDISFCKKILKKGLPFVLLTFLSVAYSKIDIVILKIIKGDIPLAIYGASTYILMAVMFIPANITQAVYPALSRSFTTSFASLVRYYSNSFRYLLILALPMAVGMTILARPIIILIWGGKYPESTLVLQISSWGAAIRFLTSILGFLMLATNRHKAIAVIMSCFIVLNLILNLLLVPNLSYLGSSIATFLTELFLFITYFIYVSRKICHLELNCISKPTLAACLLALFIYLFRSMNIYLLISLSAIFYFSVLGLVKAFVQEDFNLIKSIFRSS